MVDPDAHSNGNPSVREILPHLNEIAPLELAESWDNVGLLAGDPAMRIKTLMTCLSLTSSVLEEAIRRGVKLIVVHHPIPFKPIDRITTQTTTGKILWDAIGHGIAIYSAHTAWDNAPTGSIGNWPRSCNSVTCVRCKSPRNQNSLSPNSDRV